MGDAAMGNYFPYLVVQYQNVFAGIQGKHGMGNTQVAILNDHDAHGFWGIAELPQGEVLDDGVVLAVASQGQKFARNRPVIRAIIVVLVEHIPKPVGERVDAVDLFAGTAAAQGSDQLQPFGNPAQVDRAGVDRGSIALMTQHDRNPLGEDFETFLALLAIAEEL